MILNVDGVSQTLVQVTNENDGTVMGLYLVPNDISLAEFEIALISAEDQDEFENNNTLGVERIFAYDSILDINY